MKNNEIKTLVDSHVKLQNFRDITLISTLDYLCDNNSNP